MTDLRADILKELRARFGYSLSDIAARSAALGPQFAVSRNLISNIEHKGVTPDLRRLHALSHIFRLTVGDTFSLFGIDLQALVDTELRLHPDRTRLIEHSAFGSGAIWIPRRLGKSLNENSTAYWNQMIEEWGAAPTNRIFGNDWKSRHCLYAKLGDQDSNAAPEIPPGSHLQIVRVRERELTSPSSTAFYFIQHPWGFIASQCSLRDGVLHLHSRNPSFGGPFRLRLGSEARVLGVVNAFAAKLPAMPYQRSEPFVLRQRGTSAILPWEFREPNKLLSDSSRRFGMSRRHFDQLAEAIRQSHGIGITGKYFANLASLQRFPRTSTALTLSLITSTRLTDLFHACGIPAEDNNKFQLTELRAVNCRDLPDLVAAPTPTPGAVWGESVKTWLEWPLLLRRFLREPLSPETFVLRFNKNEAAYGNTSLLPDSCLLAIEPFRGGFGGLNRDSSASDWARRLYLIEHGRTEPRLECGYLTADDGNLILTPHRAAISEGFIAFRKNEVAILGSVIGIAATVPH